MHRLFECTEHEGEALHHVTDASPRGRRLILLVEDENVLADVCIDLLESFGYQVIHAQNIVEAMRFVRSNTFDSAMLDINIGMHTVFSVAEELAALNVPFLFVSAAIQGSMPEALVDRPFLQKPFTANVLRQRLQDLLPKH